MIITIHRCNVIIKNNNASTNQRKIVILITLIIWIGMLFYKRDFNHQIKGWINSNQFLNPEFQ